MDNPVFRLTDKQIEILKGLLEIHQNNRDSNIVGDLNGGLLKKVKALYSIENLSFMYDKCNIVCARPLGIIMGSVYFHKDWAFLFYMNKDTDVPDDMVFLEDKRGEMQINWIENITPTRYPIEVVKKTPKIEMPDEVFITIIDCMREAL